MSNVVVIYLAIVVVMSFACFIAYWLDKQRALGGGRRVPERTLHIVALLGGWPGAICAQRRFRHKTQKLSFRMVFWLVVVVHVGVVGTAGYLVFGAGST